MIAALRRASRIRRCVMLAVVAIGVSTFALVVPASAAVVTTRVSTSQYVAQGTAGSSAVSVSQDGRYAVFASDAQFVPGGYNGGSNVYLRDRTLGKTYLVTKGATGPSHTPAISGNGAYVVFASDAPSALDPAGTYRVPVSSIVAGSPVLQRVDVAPGIAAGFWNTGTALWYCPSISNNGQYVAFVSGDANLPGAVSGMLEVYRRDMNNTTTSEAVVMASLDGDGLPASRPCRTPSISGNGVKVVFATGAALVASDTDNDRDIYVRDLSAGTTAWVSAPAPSLVGSQDSTGCDSPVISDNGAVVAFTSAASDLVVGDTNDLRDVFVRNLASGVTTRVDVSSAGAQTMGGDSLNPGLSADGSWVSFQSESTDLAAAADGSHPYYAVYLRSVATTSSLTPLCPSATQGSSMDAVLLNGITSLCATTSAGPRYVGFTSASDDLVNGDNNGVSDVFVTDRFAPVLATMSTPKLSVTTPRHNVYFYVTGTVSKDTGKATVQLKFYRYVKSGGKYSYVYYKTFTTYTAAGQSSYKAKIKLPYVASWYVVAYHPADAAHLLSHSANRFFKTRT